MTTLDTLDIELLSEKLLADAFALRDDPNWEAFLKVIESTLQVGKYLQEREGTYQWIDRQLFP